MSLSGEVVDLRTGQRVTLEVAVERGLVVTKDSKPRQDTYNISGVTDPVTGELLNPSDAEFRGILNLVRGMYVNVATEEEIPIAEAIEKGLIVQLEGVKADTLTTITTRTKHERLTFSIRWVIDCNTREQFTPSEAVKRGMLDLTKGLYINLITGETMTIQTAYEKGWIIAEQTDAAAVDGGSTTESKSFVIKSCLDTESHEDIPVLESIRRGILNREMTQYTNLRTGDVLSIQEAIDRGMITVDYPLAPTSRAFHLETKSYSLKSVIDPRSGEEIPIGDAVRHQIVDKEKGLYINMVTEERLTIDEAIDRGLILTETVDKAAKKETFIEDRAKPSTSIYKLKKIRDPNTGEWFDPVEAERRGLVNKLLGQYINPLKGTKIPIAHAIRMGNIIAEEIEEPDYDDLPEDEPIYATMEAMRDDSDLHIDVVVDLRTGEEISLYEAMRRGIIDPISGQYIDLVTGRRYSISEALEQGYVRAQMRKSDSTYIQWAPTKIYSITAVVDPQTGRRLSVEEGISRGLVDMNTKEFFDPVRGTRISFQEAARGGLLIVEEQVEPGYEDYENVEFVTSTNKTMVTKSSFTESRDANVSFESSPAGMMSYSRAVELGLINEDMGMFENPHTREKMPISDAVKEGLLHNVPVTFSKEGTTEVITKKKEFTKVYKFEKPEPENGHDEEEEEDDTMAEDSPTESPLTESSLSPERNGYHAEPIQQQPSATMEAMKRQRTKSGSKVTETTETTTTTKIQVVRPDELPLLRQQQPSENGATVTKSENGNTVTEITETQLSTFITKKGYAINNEGDVVNTQTGSKMSIAEALTAGAIELDASSEKDDRSGEMMMSTSEMSYSLASSMSSIYDRVSNSHKADPSLSHPASSIFSGPGAVYTVPVMSSHDIHFHNVTLSSPPSTISLSVSSPLVQDYYSHSQRLLTNLSNTATAVAPFTSSNSFLLYSASNSSSRLHGEAAPFNTLHALTPVELQAGDIPSSGGESIPGQLNQGTTVQDATPVSKDLAPNIYDQTVFTSQGREDVGGAADSQFSVSSERQVVLTVDSTAVPSTTEGQLDHQPVNTDFLDVMVSDPVRGGLISVADAVNLGLVDMATGDFNYPRTNQILTYSEALQRGMAAGINLETHKVI